MSLHHAPLRTTLSLILASSLALLAGCGITRTPATLSPLTEGVRGSIHGGQQPIAGATIQLYAAGTTAAGTTADASPAAPLLTQPVLSDSGGNFGLSGLYTCPSASTLVYLTGTGGNPGLPAGSSNPQSALIAALGPCGNLTNSTFISLNEVTTVAAVYALAPFASGPANIGSTPANAPALASAFTLASQFADTASGTAPGPNPPAGAVVPVAQINTIADSLATCINSPGGTSGDGSRCGTFIALTTPSGTTPATDTVSTLLHLAANPTLNTAPLYNLLAPNPPFQPVQPADLAVAIIYPLTPSPTTPSRSGSGITRHCAVMQARLRLPGKAARERPSACVRLAVRACETRCSTGQRAVSAVTPGAENTTTHWGQQATSIHGQCAV